MRYLCTALAMVALLHGCASSSPTMRAQRFDSNQQCRFEVDGADIAGGRRVVIALSPAPHTVVCRAQGYKPKTKHINPPYGGPAVSFFFMVADKSDAPDSWRQVQADERARRESEGQGYADYRLLAARFAARFALKAPRGQRVAVTGFVNRDTKASAPFTALLQDEIVDGLVRRGVQVVKRDRMDVLVSELELQASALLDRKTAVRLGKLAGAQLIISGGFADRPGLGVVEVRAEVVDVTTGRILDATSGRLLRKADLLPRLR